MSTKQSTTPSAPDSTAVPAPVHIAVVLDRSGSMSGIADDIVGGFNEYLRRQQERPGDARVTLVQFDGEDPFEVLTDGLDVKRVRPLTRDSYRPRGNTPLFDAVGRMITRLDADIAHRSRTGKPTEDPIVVIITDGLENASREFDRGTVFSMVERRRRDGWVFVFLGADQDAYAEGGRMGFAGSNSLGWEKNPAAVQRMYDNLETSTGRHREKARARRRMEADLFFVENPETPEGDQ